jgi:hypothetical protein
MSGLPAILIAAFVAVIPTDVQARSVAHPDALCGTVLTPRPESGAEEHFDPHRPARSATHNVGDTETLWIHNFTTATNEQVIFTYRAVTEHSYILVANDIWNLDRVDIGDVQRLSEVFETNSGPSPGLGTGIFGLLTERFAPVTPVGGDSMVYIAITNIKSDLGGGSFIAGYVSRTDRAIRSMSNYRNLIALDGYHGLGHFREETLAHEFLHLVHIGTDSDENRWVDEGVAEYAQTLCGYPGNTGANFFQNPAVGLFNTRTTPTLADYDKSYLIVRYLADHFGDEFISRVVQNTANGAVGIDAVLAEMGYTVRFNEDLFPAWAAANLAPPNPDSQSLLPQGVSELTSYRTYDPLPYHPPGFGEVGAMPVTLSGSLPPYGMRYVRPTVDGESGVTGTLRTLATFDWSAITFVGTDAAAPVIRSWPTPEPGIRRDCGFDDPWIVFWQQELVDGPNQTYSLTLEPPSSGLEPVIVTRIPSPGEVGVSPQTAVLSAAFDNIDGSWTIDVAVRSEARGVLDRDLRVVRHESDGRCGIRVSMEDLSIEPLPENDLITVNVSSLVGPTGIEIPSAMASWQFRTGDVDNEPPDITVYLVPNPVLPEYVSVMVLSNEALYPDPAQSEGVHIVVDGDTRYTLGQSGESGRRWTGNLKLEAGEHDVVIVATDLVGNIAVATPVTYVVALPDGEASARIVSQTNEGVR